MSLHAVMAAAVAAITLAASPESPAEHQREPERIVKETCSLCHATGMGGAPKIGDRTAWEKRLRVGLEGLVRSASQGRGAMPVRGGVPDLTDDELRAAIRYMAESPAHR